MSTDPIKAHFERIQRIAEALATLMETLPETPKPKTGAAWLDDFVAAVDRYVRGIKDEQGYAQEAKVRAAEKRVRETEQQFRTRKKESELAAAALDYRTRREAPPYNDEWPAWAIPAICEVLAEHHPITDRGFPHRVLCRHGSGAIVGDFPDTQAWREHVAPIIAKRIGINPERAILALMQYRPSKV